MSHHLLRASRHFKRILDMVPGGACSRAKEGISLDFCGTIPGLAFLTIDNPKSRNSVTGPMMLDLVNAVEALGGWHDGRAVILRGAESHWCAGADFALATKLDTADAGLAMQAVMSQVSLSWWPERSQDHKRITTPHLSLSLSLDLPRARLASVATGGWPLGRPSTSCSLSRSSPWPVPRVPRSGAGRSS